MKNFVLGCKRYVFAEKSGILESESGKMENKKIKKMNISSYWSIL
jgi:hypothetical protein